MPTALQSVLAGSLVTGIFCDTAYHLHSRRSSNGKIGAPRVVYASSAVLKTSGEYFAKRTFISLDSRYLHISLTIVSPEHDKSIADSKFQQLDRETDTYGYDDDSDIEDADALFSFPIRSKASNESAVQNGEKSEG